MQNILQTTMNFKNFLGSDLTLFKQFSMRQSCVKTFIEEKFPFRSRVIFMKTGLD